MHVQMALLAVSGTADRLLFRTGPQVAGGCGFAGGWTHPPGATTASVPRGRLHAIRSAPSPSRMTTSLTHGPTIGREERRTTTAAPTASTANSRHRLAFSPRMTRLGQDHADERVRDVPGDDRERRDWRRGSRRSRRGCRCRRGRRTRAGRTRSRAGSSRSARRSGTRRSRGSRRSPSRRPATVVAGARVFIAA